MPVCDATLSCDVIVTTVKHGRGNYGIPTVICAKIRIKLRIRAKRLKQKILCIQFWFMTPIDVEVAIRCLNAVTVVTVMFRTIGDEN